MPYGQPAQLANLKPAWEPGAAPKGGRRSRDIDRTLRIARKGCPEAMLYAVQVLKDVEEGTRYRLKAAEIILGIGLPKDLDAALAQTLGKDGADWLDVRFHWPEEVIEHKPKPNGHHPGTFSVPFEDPPPKR
jgi:hypothetical protein